MTFPLRTALPRKVCFYNTNLRTAFEFCEQRGRGGRELIGREWGMEGKEPARQL